MPSICPICGCYTVKYHICEDEIRIRKEYQEQLQAERSKGEQRTSEEAYAQMDRMMNIPNRMPSNTSKEERRRWEDAHMKSLGCKRRILL